MAVANTRFDVVTLYSLPSGEKVRSIGGYGTECGKFSRPWAVCFTSSGNLLVAEASNQRVQEITPTGEHVRFIGVGVIRGLLVGVAADDNSIVTSQHGLHRIAVFDSHTGELRHSFGTKGKGTGQLCGNAGVRLTSDGKHVLVCEADNNRLSLFSLQGEFVRTIGNPGSLCAPRSACFSKSGEIVVASQGSFSVSVFEECSDTGQFEPVKTFGSRGCTDASFGKVSDITMRAGKLYVLDNDTNRVQVFM